MRCEHTEPPLDPYRSFRVHPYIKHMMNIIIGFILILIIITAHKSSPAHHEDMLYFCGVHRSEMNIPEGSDERLKQS